MLISLNANIQIWQPWSGYKQIKNNLDHLPGSYCRLMVFGPPADICIYQNHHILDCNNYAHSCQLHRMKFCNFLFVLGSTYNLRALPLFTPIIINYGNEIVTFKMVLVTNCILHFAIANIIWYNFRLSNKSTTV